jgi:UPF0755 protein
VADAHTRKHTFALIFIAIFVLIIGGGVLAATVMWSRIGEPFKGYSTAETFVEIPQGAGTAEIRRRLIDAGVIADEYTFRAALWWSGESRNLQAGEYRFAEPMSPVAVIQKIGRGDIYTRRITFPEGLTIVEMADVYESRGFGSAKSFVEAAGDTARIKDLDPEATDLEGYLFPETYSLPRNAPASRLVAQMVDRFLSTYTDSMRQSAAMQGLTTRQAVTLASLVEKETAQAQEHPLVAAVYRNRLRLNMPMQADPTVIYALQKSGRYDGNVRRDDLQYDSPYNTYRYPGLPPGPIASPGRAALEAALAPADVPYLYFVSRNDGTHVFAETLTQHNANVYEHQVLFFRKQRQAQQARP